MMKRTKGFRYLIIILLNILLVLGVLNLSAFAQEMPKMTLKHAMEEPEGPQKFSSFIKEREYLDSPYEIASPESEQLLKFIERALLKQETSVNSEWQKNGRRSSLFI